MQYSRQQVMIQRALEDVRSLRTAFLILVIIIIIVVIITIIITIFFFFTIIIKIGLNGIKLN